MKDVLYAEPSRAFAKATLLSSTSWGLCYNNYMLICNTRFCNVYAYLHEQKIKRLGKLSELGDFRLQNCTACRLPPTSSLSHGPGMTGTDDVT